MFITSTSRTLHILLLMLLWCSRFAVSANPKPVASIVLTPNHQQGMVGLPHFISDEEFVVTEVDDSSGTSSFDFTDGFMEIRAYKVGERSIQPDWHLYLPRNTKNARPEFLGQKGFVVNNGHDILRFDWNRNLLKQRSIESVCDLSLSKNALLSTLLLKVSDNLSVLVIDEDYAEGYWRKSWIVQQTWRDQSDFCWFSNETLDLVARGGAHPLEGHDVKPEEYLNGKDGTLITPHGLKTAEIRCPIKYAGQAIAPIRGGWAIECRRGEIEIEQAGRTATKKVKQDWQLNAVAESSQAPLLAVRQSKDFYGFMGADDGSEERFIVFNYEDLTTKFTFEFPRSKGAPWLSSSQHAERVPIRTIALAPSGRLLLLMDDVRLGLYQLP